MGGHVDQALVEDDDEWSHPKLQGFSLVHFDRHWEIQSERNAKVFYNKHALTLLFYIKI
jgi:hypothetical protein